MKNLHKIAPKELCWLTGEGELIPFTQLTNEHIHNIIWYFKVRSRTLALDTTRPWWFRKITKERQRMLNGVIRERDRRRYAKLGIAV